jgi:hypothetical protein
MLAQRLFYFCGLVVKKRMGGVDKMKLILPWG